MAEALHFCPFCREPFEGLVDCPDHGVRLITWDELVERDRRVVPDLDARLSPVDLRFGRGLVLLAAALVLVGLGLPATVVGAGEELVRTGFEIWQLESDYLMVVPAAAVLAVWVAFMRTTRRKLMAARYAVAGAQLIAAIAAVLAAMEQKLAVARLPPEGTDGSFRLGIGAGLVMVGLACGLVGAIRLGRAHSARGR